MNTNSNSTMSSPSIVSAYLFSTDVLRDDPADCQAQYGFSLAGKLTARAASIAINLVKGAEDALVDKTTGEVMDGIDAMNAALSAIDELEANSEFLEHSGVDREDPIQALAGYLYARNVLVARKNVRVGSFAEHFKWRMEQTMRQATDPAMVEALSIESGIPAATILKARQQNANGSVKWLSEVAQKAAELIAKTKPNRHYTPEGFRDMYISAIDSAKLQAVRQAKTIEEARADLMLLKAMQDRAASSKAYVNSDDDKAADVDGNAGATYELRDDDAAAPGVDEQLIAERDELEANLDA